LVTLLHHPCHNADGNIVNDKGSGRTLRILKKLLRLLHTKTPRNVLKYQNERILLWQMAGKGIIKQFKDLF
jgi:hypothetical protein